jgi:hypothetical protein
VGEDNEAFLSRWSRLKREAKDQPPQAPERAPEDPKSPPPELPPTEELTFESDFRAYFHPKVGEDVRRTALKKLFSDPHFNAMDGLDVYIDDYSRTDPIPPAMLAGLRQAQNILQWAKEDRDKEESAARATQAPETKTAALETSASTPSTTPVREPDAKVPSHEEDGRRPPDPAG